MQRKRYYADPARQRAYVDKRLDDAAPKWLTEEHKKHIRWFYSEARGLGLTVDHIWPIRGKNSCGLHVPWNLQLLSGAVNDKKGNKEPA